VAKLILPRRAFEDIKLLLSLDEAKLRALSEFFGSAESIQARNPDITKKVSERLGIDHRTTETVVMVCGFLLSVAEEGTKPEDIITDIRSFVAQYGSSDELPAAVDKKREAIIALLTPKPARMRALKVEYLAHGPHPTVDSFRTVCDLRPVFERSDGKEVIVGYVPTILLEARVSNLSGEGDTIVLYLTSDMLESLKNIVIRTGEKLEAIRAKFGKDLLHD